MGLDWLPANKPKAGHEPEFRKLWKSLNSGWCFRRTAKVKRLEAITESAYDTLKAPEVGIDAAADEWARQLGELRSDQNQPVSVFVASLKGFRVLQLVPPCDGIPRYSNGGLGLYVDLHSFRAQFLRDCEEIIGTAMLNRAYESMLPEAAIDYGNELLAKAAIFASESGIALESLNPGDADEGPEFLADILVAAGKWCRFWGERGHPVEAWS